MKRTDYWRQAGFGAALGVLALVLTLGLASARGDSEQRDVKLGADRPPVVNVSPLVKQLNSAFVEVARAVTPSIVRIEVKSTPKVASNDQGDQNQGQGEDPFRFFFGPNNPFHFNIPRMQPQPRQGMGSGVIVSPDGYILTNNHVIDGADKKGIAVTLSDKREFSAKLVGRDPETDIAVIKIDGEGLPTASLGNSDSVAVGEWVLAIGNPLGLSSTVTAGIVSALGRNIGIIRDQDGQNPNSYAIENFIQTDAAINPGNSGGALVDLSGQVIGINSAIESNTGGFVGYGFAIPVNLARTVAGQLIKYGKFVRPFIGVEIQAIDKPMAKALGLAEPEGVVVQRVVDDSPAKDAGIEQGDVILKADGKKINEPNTLQVLTASGKPGDVMVLTVFRNGRTFDKKVTLRPRSKEEVVAERDKSEIPTDENASTATIRPLGISVSNLTPDTKKKYDVSQGVLVTDVDAAGPAASRGIREGDVILDVDRKPIKSVGEFQRMVREQKSGDSLLLKVKGSDKTTRLVAVELQ